MQPFSVVTIVKGRRIQLANLLESVAHSTRLPYDVQVVAMDDPADIAYSGPLNVTVHALGASTQLPLARARNQGFAAAQTPHIIFIDVDCIVSPTLFSAMLQNLDDHTVVAAYPRYLPFVPHNGQYAAHYAAALPHPGRAAIPSQQPVNHLKFWSIIFAMTRSAFNAAGGFDETFTGYGAEDTDFAMSFNMAGAQHVFVDDGVLHQYHDKYNPPLNHFADIIKNAERYRDKWGELPMMAWLHKFADLGFIKPPDPHKKLEIIAIPTSKQIEQARSKEPF